MFQPFQGNPGGSIFGQVWSPEVKKIDWIVTLPDFPELIMWKVQKSRRWNSGPRGTVETPIIRGTRFDNYYTNYWLHLKFVVCNYIVV